MGLPTRDELRRDLAAIVGDARLSMELGDLDTYSRDMWPRLMIARRFGASSERLPHVVVWPETVGEVAALVRYARGRRMPIVPYGGGSGVCGGTVPVQGGITVDTKRMDRLVSVSRADQTCDVQAGANGERFERQLQARGYTLGHFPSSIYCSTVGGWLACRAAGQLSTKYGKIEDRVVGLTLVTGRGEVVHTDGLARASRGPNWTQLVVGSEGTLGIITSARLRINLAPELLIMRGFEFPDVASGVEAIRRVMQRGLRPAIVRLYDEVDTFINHSSVFSSDGPTELRAGQFAPAPSPGTGALPRLKSPAGKKERSRASRRWTGRGGGLRNALIAKALSRPRLVNSVAGTVAQHLSKRGCRMIVGLEGTRIRTEVEARLTFAELELAGGVDLGEDPGREWLEHRYSVSYKMSEVFAEGAFVDTMEVAATWDRLLDLYDSVREAISRHAVVMAHFSHAYPDGCSIYFSFAGRGETQEEGERIYDAIWRDGIAAATRAAGTISHHHGIGLLKSRFMASEHREAMSLLAAVKDSFDPDGIMNPGKLGIPALGSRIA